MNGKLFMSLLPFHNHTHLCIKKMKFSCNTAAEINIYGGGILSGEREYVFAVALSGENTTL